MNSTLSPREIQTRIRAGETLDDVAQAAGVPAEKIEPFAAPVLAERAHVAGVALASPVRRPGEPSSARSLRTVVTDALAARSVDPDDVEWDAWQLPDRRWLVRGTWGDDGVAEFAYDKLARFSVAHDEGAKDLTGERPRTHRGDPDHEPTVDFSDEFAIVRAVGAEAPRDEAAAAPEPPQAGESRKVVEPATAQSGQEERSPAEAAQGSDDFPAGDGAVGSDDWAEGSLEKVDGVYEIVPGRGELDNLYDMFHSFAEDSVEIYPGLGEVRPVGGMSAAEPPTAGEPAGPSTPTGPEPGNAPSEPQPGPLTEPEAEPAPTVSEPTPEPVSRLSRRQRKKLAAAQRQQAEPAVAPRDEPTQLPLDEAEPKPAPAPTVAGVPPRPGLPAEPTRTVEAERPSTQAPPQSGRPTSASKLEELRLDAGDPDPQPHPGEHDADDDLRPVETLVDEPVELDEPVPGPQEPEQTVVLPRKRPPAKKRRASVPSWDEIMFGGPRKD